MVHVWYIILTLSTSNTKILTRPLSPFVTTPRVDILLTPFPSSCPRSYRMTPSLLTTLHRGLPIKVSDSDRKQKQFLQTACKNIAPSKWLMDCFFFLVHYRLMCFSLSEQGVPWYPQILTGQLTPSQPWGTDHAHHITTAPTPCNFRPSYGPVFNIQVLPNYTSFYIVKCLNWIPLYEIVIIPWTWMTPTSEHLAVTWSFFDRVRKN